MRSPFINQGSVPSGDGAVTRYVSPEVVGKAWYNPAKPVIFVNGMQNSGELHRDNALALSLMVGAPVHGVYNKSTGFLSDVFQCVTDKLRLAGIQAESAGGQTDWYKTVESLYQLERKRNAGLSKDDFVHGLLGSNEATKALYALLIGAPNGLLGAPIYSHSQGNLIASNALTGVMLARGPAGADRAVHASGFNATAEPACWFSEGELGLDQGMVVLMVENFRSGRPWRLLRTCGYLRAGLRRAGFRGGWLRRPGHER